MEENIQIELDRVRARMVNRKNLSRILFTILYIAALFLVFIPGIYGLDKNTIPLSLKIVSLFVYISSLFIILKDGWAKPEEPGKLQIYQDRIKFKRKSYNKTIPFTHINKIIFDYFGYAGIWTSRPYGNGNYITIEHADGEENEYEIKIRNREEKEKLKKILRSIQSKGIHVVINVTNKLRAF